MNELSGIFHTREAVLTDLSVDDDPAEKLNEISKQVSDEHPFFLFDWYNGFLFFRNELGREAYVARYGPNSLQGEIVMGVVTHEGFSNHGKAPKISCLGGG